MEPQTAVAGRSHPTSLYVFLVLVVTVLAVALGGRLASAPPPAGPLEATADGAYSESLGGHHATPVCRSSVAPARTSPLMPVALVADRASAAESLAAAAAPGVGVDDALIVRTANLELEVQDVAAALAAARSAILELGGYVSGSDAYDQGESRWASGDLSGARWLASARPSMRCAAAPTASCARPPSRQRSPGRSWTSTPASPTCAPRRRPSSRSWTAPVASTTSSPCSCDWRMCAARSSSCRRSGHTSPTRLPSRR